MRTMIKAIYITIIKVMDRIITIKPKKNHIVVTMTFTEDVLPIIKKLVSQNVDITLLYHPNYNDVVNKQLNYDNITAIPLNNKYVIQHIRAVKRAKVVLIDTYYLMFGAITKQKDQEVIQIWHASSALKRFGLEDRSVDLSNNKMVNQYKRVYDFTDSYIVAGDNMIDIFKQSLNATHKHFIKTGLPRLEYSEVPQSEGDAVLFVPTYRDYTLKESDKLTHRDIKQLLIRAHPSDNNYKTDHEISHLSLDECMNLANIIITDYSSLAIEALYKGKRVLLYVPDEAAYDAARGLNQYYYALPANLKAYTVEDLQNKLSSIERININGWTNYQTNDATDDIVHYIKEKLS
ncbi:CDP-glycerol glycerophosphotransferase family protein [Macrococcus armenti]|uniref:CDP-glycerol glycerophosphotransferase family protein n=1 Tax=Macrococcus armenti TaxID=2875764 RepID=UPI001CCF9371|nr:CDP-glycerol glycerophosphotransferase family protein [Macrococcus armenti]UBH16102.1 CDP-glycerol glycerophosphotransferase family protein [Macrococcus armenti]UBH18462.1 CDP-glycerol glycerophosphotransferase family protein [Macrococcus armenti]UBH20729.1 CDP-glycerol glycerophosphotransferase family protein [Macrococcus armenti]